MRVFRFPKDEKYPRKNFVPNNHGRVCECHFEKEDFIYKISQQDTKTGEIVSVSLTLPRLKETSVPSKFPNCPKYLSNKMIYPKSKDEKFKELDEIRFQQAIEESKQEYLTHKTLTSYTTFEELKQLFRSFNLNKTWFFIFDENGFTIFKVEHTPGPTITWAVAIANNLEVNTYLYSQLLTVEVSNVKTPFFHQISKINHHLIIIYILY